MAERLSDPDANPLILTSAFYHPDKTLRRVLKQRATDWVDRLEPQFTENDIRDLILGEEGTVLEPFELKTSDIGLAVILARAAFSKKSDVQRCRIVSRETIGRKGGLVITRNLKSYYPERYRYGKYRRNPQAGFNFLPAFLPGTDERHLFQMTKAAATLHVNDHGFVIRVPWPHTWREGGELARDLQVHSRLSNATESFDQLGLRVETEPGLVVVQTGSPEAQIKLMAHMTNGETMVLAKDAEGKESISIVLDMPVDDKLHLKSLFTTTGVALDWLKCPCAEGIKIEKNEMVGIASWLPPHYSWVDEIWDELI